MKSFRLLEAMGDIDDKYIEKAWLFRKTKIWKRVLPIAACMFLIAGTVLLFYKSAQNPVYLPELPKLQLDFETEGMGFEGLGAYGIDEIVNNNPWNEDSKLETMPVFQRAIEYTAFGEPSEADLEGMREWALKLAGELEMVNAEPSILDSRQPREEVNRITENYEKEGKTVPEEFWGSLSIEIRSEKICITVNSQMQATIEFISPVSLPQQYNFAYSADYEETHATGEYLLQKYTSLLNMKQPVLNICGGARNTSNEQSYNIEIYDGEGSIQQQIVGYNLYKAIFSSNEAGELVMIRLNGTLPAEKVGDYPIISPDEATKLLEQKKYLTTVPVEFPGMEYVQRVELMYRGGNNEKTMIPYYRFYVELPDMAEGRRNLYGGFYVPAVASQYIENTPIWNGSYN